MAPMMVAYGGGTNSTAMLVGLHERGERPDLILFSDTGGEKPHTYQHIGAVNRWCEAVGFPTITMVGSVEKHPTLEIDCIARKSLPSLAYGFKTCSQRFKRAPQEKYVRNWPPARDAWARGDKVQRLVGYDADEDRRAKPYDDPKYASRYPLIEWGWARQDCVEAIARAGLAIEDNAQTSSVEGLGRRFSWRIFLHGDPRQDRLFPPEAPCDCNDG